MRQRLTNFVNGLRDKWNSFENTDKIKIVIAFAAVVIALGAVIFFAVKPKMTAVYTGLSYMNGLDGQNELANAGIYSEYKSGDLLVRQADIGLATRILAASPITALNNPDTSFADAMNLLSMGQTGSTQTRVFEEGEANKLGARLEMFDGITSAKVNIVWVDETRAFMREAQKATMSVNLVTTKDLTSADGQVLARYLCKSVKGLSMEDIEITDQNYTVIYSGTKLSADGYSEAYDLELLKKTEMEQKVRALFLPMFDNVSILTTLDINFDRLAEQVKSYNDPNTNQNQTGFATEVYQSQSSVTGTEQEGEPGIGTNDNTAPDYQMGESQPVNAKTKEEQTKYIYDEILQSREYAPGVINYDNSSISIRAIKNQVYYEEDLQDYIRDQGLAETTTWRQFRNGIQEFALSPLSEDEANNLLMSVSIGTGISQDKVHIISYTQSVFMDMQPKDGYTIQQYIQFGILMLLILLLLYGFIKKTKQDEITEVEPELTVEDLLVSTQIEEEKEAEVEKLQDITFGQESETMRQIEGFIAERPEAVAQLLRNWINEDWE